MKFGTLSLIKMLALSRTISSDSGKFYNFSVSAFYSNFSISSSLSENKEKDLLHSCSLISSKYLCLRA